MLVEQFLMWAKLLPEPMLLLSEQGVILAVSHAAAKALGRDPQAMRGRRVSDLVADPSEKVAGYLADWARSGQLLMGALTWRMPDGRQVKCRCEGGTMDRRAEQGIALLLRLKFDRQLDQFALLTKQIGDLSQVLSSRQQLMESLRESREQLSSILSTAGEGIVSLDQHGKVQFLNVAAQIALGYGMDELLGHDLHEATHYASHDGVPYQRKECPIIHILREGEAVTCDSEVFWRKDGAAIPVEYTATVKRSEQGDITGAVVTFRDISARKKAEADLAQAAQAIARHNEVLAAARDQALAAVTAKNEFLVAMNHEIRTPMNTIIGMAELLAEAPLPNELRAHVERLGHSSEALLGLIDRILDFSKADAKEMELQRAPFDLRLLIERAAHAVAVQAHAKGLDVITVVDPSLPSAVLGDGGRLRQALTGVLDNAVKFTHSGRIVVTVTPDQDGASGMVHFAVADTGIGIPSDKVDTVFEAFTQLDSSNTRQYGGTGLGLSLVKQLVELMGGRVRIVSLVGQGSTVSFTAHLPASDAPAAASGSLSQMSTLRAGPRRILIVDDLEDNRDVVRLFLKGTPLVLEEVENGALAVEKVKAGSYDLVLMDMQMPVMDGYTATKLIREWEQAQQREPTPIVALTADALQDDRQKGLEAGCTAYLTKPVKKKTLLESIDRYASSQPA